MERKRAVPYGVISYGRMVDECYIVDHTRFIRELENYQTPVFLRPKRFGKSFVCSMLEYYYDINRKDVFDHYFGHTDIGRDPTPLASSFLVFLLDFSTITVGSLAEIERDFAFMIKDRAKTFISYNGNLRGRDGGAVDWSAVERADSPSTVVDAIRGVIARNGLPPLYVIVDEYDNFTNELIVSNRDAEYDAICGHDSAGPVRESFFKAMFKSFKAGLRDDTVGRTYFTGVLPITLDDMSSGFNVGTVVSHDDGLLGMAGFTQDEVNRYVDEIMDDNALPPEWKPRVLSDLKAFYDGYHMMPAQTDGLYNSTITNWYLLKLVRNRRIPALVIDANVCTDIGWFRRLAVSNENALERIRAYVERGEGENADPSGLSAKFGRAKFFSKEFFPYALYYLGLLTFEDAYTLGVPNLTVKNMFVDYYDELMQFENGDVARRQFIAACEALTLKGGAWAKLFEQYWQHYVKARIPAQAYDQMNENFFRLTFTSRCWDALTMFYSFEQEYNTPEGRIDFLATPKPGTGFPACMAEFKYYRRAEFDSIGVKELSDGSCDSSARTEPDAETLAQARRYRDSLPKRPGWDYPVECVVVEVYSHFGYRWFPVD